MILDFSKNHPRSLAAIALFGAVLVEAAGNAMASDSTANSRLLHFFFFNAGAVWVPLFFFASGWLGGHWSLHAGSAEVLRQLAGRVTAALLWGVLLCSPLLIFDPQAARGAFFLLPILEYLALFTLVASALRQSPLMASLGRILSAVVAKPGGLILLGLPSACTLFLSGSWHGSPTTASIMPGFLLVPYGTLFAAGWWGAGSVEVFDRLTRRWRFRLIVACVLSFALYSQQVRLISGTPLIGMRRVLFSLTYMLFVLRSVLALAGAFRAGKLRVPRLLSRLAEASFCCYALHWAWTAWFARVIGPPLPTSFRFVSISLATIGIGWVSYELLVRRTKLREWLAWNPLLQPDPAVPAE